MTVSTHLVRLAGGFAAVLAGVLLAFAATDPAWWWIGVAAGGALAASLWADSHVPLVVIAANAIAWMVMVDSAVTLWLVGFAISLLVAHIAWAMASVVPVDAAVTLDVGPWLARFGALAAATAAGALVIWVFDRSLDNTSTPIFVVALAAVTALALSLSRSNRSHP